MGVIKELESWFQRNGLIINVGKTVVLSCHSRQKKKKKKKKDPGRLQDTFNKTNLICTAETKFLGACIMEKLKWNTHVKSLANNLSKVSFYLTRERWRGGYFDPTRIHFSAVSIFLGIITRQFTYLLLHSSPYLRCHWHFLRTAGIRDNGRNV